MFSLLQSPVQNYSIAYFVYFMLLILKFITDASVNFLPSPINTNIIDVFFL